MKFYPKRYPTTNCVRNFILILEQKTCMWAVAFFKTIIINFRHEKVDNKMYCVHYVWHSN